MRILTTPTFVAQAPSRQLWVNTKDAAGPGGRSHSCSSWQRLSSLAGSALHASLDAAGEGSPFPLALMHTVAQAAKDHGVPLSREQLLWVLTRAKADERVAISLATSQMSARRALPVLKTPQALERFDVSRVTGAMVRKVKETLKLEALQARCLPPHPSPPLAPR